MNKYYYEVKVRFEKTLENGMTKKVKEAYLFDAMSFSEAESSAIRELTPFIIGEFDVTDIKRVNYTEIFPSDKEKACKWYAVRINFITLDERTGAEKKTKAEFLVQASDIYNAKDNFNAAMKGTMVDYEITFIKETPIMNVYPYDAELERMQKELESSLQKELESSLQKAYNPNAQKNE